MAFDPLLWQWIVQDSRRYGLDPRAVAAIAENESGGNRFAVGDGGTSFGFAQLHRGGALPPGGTPAWAASRAGVDYVLQHMGLVARGMTGAQAVRNIAYRFERPANPGAEAAVAMRYYNQPSFATGSPIYGGGGTGYTGGGGGTPSTGPGAAADRPPPMRQGPPPPPLIQLPFQPAMQSPAQALGSIFANDQAGQPQLGVAPDPSQLFPTRVTPSYGAQLQSLHDTLLRS